MRTTAAALFLGFTLVSSVHAQTIGPAPKGPAEQVAMAAITDAGHPCGTVDRATRTDRGGIRAVCSNGEAYRAFTVHGQLVAMKRSAAGQAGSLTVLKAAARGCQARRISLLNASARLNSTRTTDHASALQRVCSITRRTRLMRSQRC